MENTVIQRVLMLKSELNLTDQKFCSLAGISIATFQKIKRGESVSDNTIKSIMIGTGVNQDWLMHGIGEMEITPIEEKSTANRESISALKNHINHLTDEVKFYRQIIQNMTVKGAQANFNLPTALAGVLPQNFGSSVRVSA